ncbi:MAG: hypothetical protein ACTTK0_08670, partial [Stomatobaculum sp.]
MRLARRAEDRRQPENSSCDAVLNGNHSGEKALSSIQVKKRLTSIGTDDIITWSPHENRATRTLKIKDQTVQTTLKFQ